MRAWFATRMPSVGPVLGASVPRTQSAPSSRCGRNSEPITSADSQIDATAKAGNATADRRPSVIGWSSVTALR